MNIPAPPRMTVPEYFDWAMRQPRGRFELVDGKVFQMSPETKLHVRVKGKVFRALEEAIEAAAIDCAAYGDGTTVRIDEANAREPDAVVQGGPETDFHSTTVDEPLIVVEVLSPTSVRGDTSVKFAEYFSLPTVRHYLIVDPVKKLAIHHYRGTAIGEIASRIVTAGDISFEPPGFSVAVERFFEGLPPAAGKDTGGKKP